MPELTFHPDGSFSQAGIRQGPPPLEMTELDPARRAFFERVEAWIAEAHEKLRWRSVRIDDDNVLETFQVALPRSINEKLTWRKLFDRDPRFPVVMDKIAVKHWLHREGMPLRAPDLIWHGTDPETIPAAALDRRAVAKAAHGWQAQLFIRPGETTLEELREAGRSFMAHRHGYRLFEWGYEAIPARIVIEEEVVPARGERLEEVKVYVFGDRIERVLRIFDRYGRTTGQLWEADADGVVRRSSRPPEVAESVDPGALPPNWPELMRAAQRLAAPFDHMRVDMLTDGTQAVLNEMTVYNQGGRVAGIGVLADHPATRAWDLRRSWFLTTPHQDPFLEEYRRALRRLLDEAGPHAEPGRAALDRALPPA